MKLPKDGRELTKQEHDTYFRVKQGAEPDDKVCEKCFTYFDYWLTMCPKCGGMAVMDSLEADRLLEEAGVDWDESWRKLKPVVDDLLSKLKKGVTQ